MLCPNNNCKRIVSAFEDKCPNCGVLLKDNPVKNYTGKADKITGKAEAGAEEVLAQMQSGFKARGNAGGLHNSSQASHKINPEDALSRESKGHKPTDNLQNMPGYRHRSDNILATIQQRKTVKVNEMKGIVFASTHVAGNADYSLKANITDFLYRQELPPDEDPEQEALVINAYASYDSGANRYMIQVLDGFLNFMLGVESFFKLKNEAVLLDFMVSASRNGGRLSLEDTVTILEKYVPDKALLFEIIENAFIPCFETIAHELGHVCLGHCRNNNLLMPLEVSRNQEREADSFASSIIGTLFHAEAKKPLFISYIKCEFAWALQDKIAEKFADQAAKATTHPLAEERLKNAIRSNSDLATELGITEDWFEKTMNAVISKLIKNTQPQSSQSEMR